MTKSEILQDLRSKILNEYYAQGQSLIERELCEIYSISRTPVREILWSLVVDGIVEQRPSRGFSVRKLGRDQIFEIFQAREAVEGMAARIACKRADAFYMNKIQELYDQLKQVNVEQDSSEGVRIGRIMHKLILDAAANSLLSDIYVKLNYLASLTSNIAKKSVSTEVDSKKFHLAVMHAILSGDTENSEQYMREHLRITCRHIIEMLYPQVFSSTETASIDINILS